MPNNLQEVVRYVRSAIDQHCVFVHMTAPQIETLLNGLEDSQKRIAELEAESQKWQAEAKRQYILFNAELDLTRKLREALEDADVFDPTRHRFKMDANGNLTPIEEESA